MVRAPHHREMEHAGEGAVGVVLRAPGDVAVNVGALAADADGLMALGALLGEEFLHVFHQRSPRRDRTVVIPKARNDACPGPMNTAINEFAWPSSVPLHAGVVMGPGLVAPRQTGMTDREESASHHHAAFSPRISSAAARIALMIDS